MTTTTGRCAAGSAALAGAFLVCAAYAWIVLEVMGLLLTAWLLVLAAIAGVRRLIGRPSEHLMWSALLLAIVVAVFHIGTVPWRIVAESRFRPGDYWWTSADDVYWHHQWSPDTFLADHGWYWLIDGEANTACEVDPARCR